MFSCNTLRKTLAVFSVFFLFIVCSGCGDASDTSSEAAAAGTVETAAETETKVENRFSHVPDDVGSYILNESGMRVVSVSTVDEFLNAIGESTEIVFEPGKYDLTSASDYGRNTFSDYYLWQEVFDGYQLVIHGACDLIIRGEDSASTLITTDPRYANVIAFEGCSCVTIEGLTLGHSIDHGECVGGVLYFDCMDAAYISTCSLYGCGVTGIWANDSCYITVDNTEIYNCSGNAACAYSCYSFQLDDCSIHDCPGDGYSCYALFDISGTTGFVLSNCDINGNSAAIFMDSYQASSVCMLGCEIEGNTFTEALFRCEGIEPVVDKCYFAQDQLSDSANVYYFDGYQESLKAVDLEGEILDSKDIFELELEYTEYSPSLYSESDDYSEPREIYADTVDEFLEGIAPNTTIYINNGEYHLSDASDYGYGGSSFYYWEPCYEGWSLVIHNVENLSIYGLNPVNVSILSDCISADIISFINCSGVIFSGFTLGHSIEGFSCSGGVIRLQGSENFLIDYCRLFGCGIMGITASSCGTVKANYCEIYDCSNGAVELYNTDLLEMTDCYIHDCGAPTLSVSENSHISINGNEYDTGYYTIQNETSEGSSMWASGGEAEEFAREIVSNALNCDYDALANKVYYPVTIAGKTYKYASQLAKDLDLIIAEDFEDALEDEDFADIVSDRHGWSIVNGYIKFAQYDSELLIYEINPPSVG